MAWTAPKTWAFQEGLESAEFNVHIRDNLLAVGPHLINRKTADQSITTSTALTDCTSMVLPVSTNEVYKFEFHVIYSAGTTEDMQLRFTFPTAGRIDAAVFWWNDASSARINEFTGTTSPTSTQAFVGGGVNTRYSMPIHGIFTTSTTAGNLTLQFAQVVSGASATTIFANSTVWAVKLA